ncbi:hypothetical protein Zm00014a_033819 [Zea mays]|uniref:Uncharacterized protein n=1 Tax=Zea mays TaxID=4577 RepID=A0A3L6GBI5_MAIZE|nr:hypothetical protein Zm00014a_033819 [Zea mays]
MNTVLHDELDDLEIQRLSIKERKDAVKKKKNDTQKADDSNIVDQNRKKIEKFEFENTTPPVEICDELWKKI